MLSTPMMRVLHTVLQLFLALVLGFGPLGASLLAASLHAPLCGCAGCGADAAAESCCEVSETASDGPALVASERNCPCALGLPSREASPATAPRVCAARNLARVELERGQRAVELAWSVAPFVAQDSAGESPPEDSSEPGPPGSRRERGAARAAALGALLV